MNIKRQTSLGLFVLMVALLLVVSGIDVQNAFASQLQLNWIDTSTNEDGFKIERAIGSAGTFGQIAIVVANTTSYNDTSVTPGIQYCYRIRAYNSGGDSAYSNAACATALSSTVSLSIATVGTGTGTVTTSPTGINCGTTCTASFSTGTVVTMNAVAATGSTFSGWSGDADCSDGSVTLNANTSCTATFQAQTTTPTFTLSVNLVKNITSLGTGNGSVTSVPAGISCGTDCSEVYSSGTSVNLTATAAAGSTFTGWSGACTGTGSCVLSMTANTSVTATFAPRGFNLVVNKHGQGKVVSAPSGIDCGLTCSATYLSGASVTLTPQADPGASFLGWTSGGCSGLGTCTITLGANTTVTANFSSQLPASIGIFRPSAGIWALDLNGNGFWDDCNVDLCISNFGDQNDIPVVGSWNGGQTSLGVFDSKTATWYLDLNGNFALDGCELNTCAFTFGSPGDKPVVGDWTGTGQTRVGVFRPSTRTWYFDINGNGKLDSCRLDICTKSFGLSTDIPVVGDWTGTGKTKIGVFRPTTGQWILDSNGDKKLGKGCSGDICVTSFGQFGDIPVVGDWDGSGTDKIGIFRPSTSDWLLDLNGNGVFDGCGVDACLSFGMAGDLPVIGNW